MGILQLVVYPMAEIFITLAPAALAARKRTETLLTEERERKSLRGTAKPAAHEVFELEEIALQTWEDEGGSVGQHHGVKDRVIRNEVNPGSPRAGV